MTPYRHYFNLLTKREKCVYLALEAALSEMKSEISVPSLDFSRISEIHTMIRLDAPLLFNSDCLTLSRAASADSVKVKPHYTMSKKEYCATLAAISKRLGRIISKAPGESLEKEKFIHDFLVTNVKYDKLKKQYSHEVTGPLCHGIGVCEGMSKTFKLMCDAVGIDCICVIGDGVPLESSTGRKWEKHMWNMVKLEGSWACVDVTFDSSLSHDSVIRYDYFNVSDSIMERSHSSVMFKVPSARGKADYYAKLGRRYTASDDILPAVKDAMKAPYISVFRYDTDDAELLKKAVVSSLRQAGRGRRFEKFSFVQSKSGVTELRLYPEKTEPSKDEK